MRSVPPLLALMLATIPTTYAYAQWPANGVALCTAANAQQSVAIADNGHGAIVAWEDSRALSGTYDIYATCILPSGVVDPAWPVDGLPVCVATNAQQSPQVASDGAGGAFIVWQDQRNGTSDYGVYMQRVTRDGTLAGGWPQNGIAVCDTVRNQDAPQLVPDGAGGVYAVWVDTRADAANSDIYARRVQADGTSAPGWPATGLAVCTATGLQNQPVIARDGTNGVIIVWLDRRSGDYDVYAARLTPSGARAPGWAADGNLVARTPGSDEQSAVAASDGAGGLFAAWVDYRSGAAGDLFAQHLTSAGLPATGWESDGLPLCVAAGQQLSPRILADVSTGFFAVWEDYRGAGDVYAARVQADGTPAAGWVADGLPLCDAAGFQIGPRLTTDGAGGFFATWSDTRASAINWDLYISRVDGNGLLHAGWTVNGNVLCNAAGVQEQPVIRADGSGGAWVAWQDKRTAAQFDVYASRVGPTFGVTADAGAPEAGARFAAGPSPFRDAATLRLRLPGPGDAQVAIYDMSGRRVRTLADGALAAGEHAWLWDGRDDRGHLVPPGVYLARVSGPGVTAQLRLARVR